MNKVFLQGRFTFPVETTTSKSGKVYFKNSLAIEAKETHELTSFINVTAFGTLANLIVLWCGKGSLVSIIGRLSINKKTNPDGTHATFASVIIEDINFYESKYTKAAKQEIKQVQYLQPRRVEHDPEAESEWHIPGINESLPDSISQKPVIVPATTFTATDQVALDFIKPKPPQTIEELEAHIAAKKGVDNV